MAAIFVSFLFISTRTEAKFDIDFVLIFLKYHLISIHSHIHTRTHTHLALLGELF